MKLKQIFALLLALLLTLGLLAGCGAGEIGEAAGAALELIDALTAETAADETAPAAETPARETAAPQETDEDGEYTDPLDVAAYLNAYGHLPGNFITKSEARDLGWPGGDLWKYAPGKSIGGDFFGNREGLLPEDTRYHECDVNYAGGSRGAERLIYGDDGSIYYTSDHYGSFTQLY